MRKKLKNLTNTFNLYLALIIGIFYGAFRAVESLCYSNISLQFGQYSLFMLYFIAIFLILILLFYFSISVTHSIITKINKKWASHIKNYTLFLFLLIFFSLFINSKWSSVYYKHFESVDTAIGGIAILIGKLLIIIAVSLLTTFFFDVIIKKYKKLSLSIQVCFSIGSLLFVFLGGFLLTEYKATKGSARKKETVRYQFYKKNHNKVLLLGADGADLKIIEELTSKGLLPNISFLLKNGTYAELKTLHISITPRVWPTLCTGKLPSKHGISSFYKFYFTGIKEGIYFPSVKGLNLLFINIANFTNLITYQMPTRYDYHCTPLWQILSDFNCNVGVVRWNYSWPAPKIHGRFISDGAIHLIKKITNGEWKKYEKEAKTFFQPYDDFITNTPYSIDYKKRFYFNILKKMIQKQSYDFFMLGLNINDTPQHNYFRYFKPQYFPFDNQEKIKLFNNKIPDSYQQLDHYVGNLLRLLPSDWILFIVSDHGGSAVLNEWISNRGGGNHTFQIHGLFIAYGEGIKRGHKIKNIRVEDITPTILRIYNLPPAEDMDGKPVFEIFTEKFKKNLILYPSISTYESKKPEKQKHDKMLYPFSKKELQRFKALGYLN